MLSVYSKSIGTKSNSLSIAENPISTMSNKGNNISNQGTNAQGNSYTAYEGGAYRYTNYGNDNAKPASHYYDTGKGHGFYSQNNTADSKGYSFHDNMNQGTRTYMPRGGSGKK